MHPVALVRKRHIHVTYYSHGGKSHSPYVHVLAYKEKARHDQSLRAVGFSECVIVSYIRTNSPALSRPSRPEIISY